MIVKIKGFTLAEVLVTLVIIGAVAAMTIPSLVNNIGDQQNKVAWRKAFADLSQVTTKIVADNGSLKGVFVNDNSLRDTYIQYLSYVKSCDSTNSSGNCWHSNGNFRVLNGSTLSWNSSAGAILNNGYLLYFELRNSNCTSSTYGTPTDKSTCGVVVVDINGFQGPNTYGKDFFAVHVLEDSIKPFGTQGDIFDPAITCIPGSTDSSNTGRGCSALYLYQ